MTNVWIYLENGTYLQAKSFGAKGTSVGEIVFNTTCKFDSVNCVWISNDNLLVFDGRKEDIKSLYIYTVNDGEIKFNEIEYDIFKEVNATFLNCYEILAFANSKINKSYILIDYNSFINKLIKYDCSYKTNSLVYEFEGCDLDISLNKFVNECLYSLNEITI